MIPLAFKLILFCAYVSSDIFYIILLHIIHKNKDAPPFNSSFFVFAFHLGVLDLLHLNGNWLFQKFPMFGWFGMDKLVMLNPVVIGTIADFCSWFTAIGQISGVALLAANRVSVIGFDWIWSKKLVRISVILLWMISLVICLPQLFVAHRSYKNSTLVDGVMYYWIDGKAAKVYFTGCIFYCVGSASLSAIMYAITYYRVRQQKAASIMSGAPDSAETKFEIKLAITGVILFLLTGVYAIYCGTYSLFASNHDLLPYVYTFKAILEDVFSWINPYLLMMCSPTAREQFWKALKRHRSRNNRVENA